MTKTFYPKELPVGKVHGLLSGSVGPRPIAFASTLDEKGRPNLSPFSFFNVFSANPPILVFSPARRGRDNTTKHTYENVKKVAEVVINVVNYDMVHQMSLSSTEYPEGTNEFLKAGFTQEASEKVKPFRVKEAPVQMECIVNEVVELGKEGGAGNLVICEVVAIHVNEDVMDENGKINQHKIDLVGRCGGNWYTRASGEAIFEVAKPLTTMGIGVDAIPSEVRGSKFLTGNDLGKLGNIESLPNETDVNDFKLIELSELFIELEDDQLELEQKLHKMAHNFLENDQIEEAWKTLLTFNNG